MGLKSQFNKFLSDTAPNVFEDVHMSHYAFKKVAVDFSLYLNKFKAIAGDTWVKLFIRMVAGLRRNHVHCVFIYDGEAPPEKESERQERRENKKKNERRIYDIEMALDHYHETGEVKKVLIDLYGRRRSPKRLLAKKAGIHEDVDIKWVENKLQQLQNQLYEITEEDFNVTKELFDILQVPYYTAPSEAETMCADLCKRGLVDAVLSEDTDVMAYGTPAFLSKLDNTSFETCRRVRYDLLLEYLEMTDEQFLDLCIMCGTDYNPNIAGVGSKTAYKYLIEHVSIEAIIQNIKPKKNQDFTVLNHVRVRQLFREHPRHPVKKVPFCGKPDFGALEQFMKKHNISVRMDILHRDFNPAGLTITEDDEEPEFEIEDSDEEAEDLTVN